jgi:hypothetical protein
MRAARRIYSISAGLFTARCQLTSPVASVNRASGNPSVSALWAAAE